MSNVSFDAPGRQILARRAGWSWGEGLGLVFVAFVGIDMALAFLVGLSIGIGQLAGTGGPLADLWQQDSVTVNFWLFVLSRTLAFALLYWFLRRRGLTLGTLGFQSFRPLQSLGLVLLSAGLFVVFIQVVFEIILTFWPHLNLEQEQDIVFATAQTGTERLLAFLALVVIAPLVEEILFRGVLFAGLLKRFNVAAATLVTSLLFGLIHGQLNISVVTAVLSVFLCLLYYKTQSLWPAIMLHSLKNLIAFSLLFELV